MTLTRMKSTRIVAGTWLAGIAALVLLIAPAGITAPVAKVAVVSDDSGSRLQVDGKDFMILGMNWDYFPIGTTYNYSLWTQPDDVIKAALDQEMPLLKSMGVNAIRQYVGVTPKWVKYIYENYDIFTVLNHSFGRYGVTVLRCYGGWRLYSEYRLR